MAIDWSSRCAVLLDPDGTDAAKRAMMAFWLEADKQDALKESEIEITADLIQQARDDATMAERERCAQVAAHLAAVQSDPNLAVLARSIATEIRKG